MPVEPQEATEGLKPEGVREAKKHSFCPIGIHDKKSNLSSKDLHPLKQPGRSFSIMKREMGDSGSHVTS